MLRLNGIDVEIILKPLSFYVNMPSEIIEKDENISENTKETYDNENLEEKQTEFN